MHTCFWLILKSKFYNFNLKKKPFRNFKMSQILSSFLYLFSISYLKMFCSNKYLKAFFFFENEFLHLKLSLFFIVNESKNIKKKILPFYNVKNIFFKDL